MIEARFDDLGPTPHSFRFVDPVGVIEARRPDEVRDALAAVEAATGRGLWAAGLCAYEAAPGLDPSLAVRRRPAADPFAEFPLVWFSLFDAVEPVRAPEAAEDEPAAPLDAWRPSTDRARYDAAIARIREHVAEGDTYQVNHTLRLRARIVGDERGLYRDLCLAQRGSYAAYLNIGRYRVLSASPELFFRIEDDRITTRPMKGTAARGRWSAEDDEAARALVASEKDRAENAMIADLLRNDLGRIAVPGSVEVPLMLEAERYETVWQLTSTITARLRSGAGLVDVFGALFPSGSVTGAPKVRSMQIISQLEDSPRGIYCGSVGFVAPPGADEVRTTFNVAIRTVMLDSESGLAEYGVGGGITHDSRADAEYDEVLAKARVLSVRRPAFELLETLRHAPAEGFTHLDLHLERLSASARYFGFVFDRAAADEALHKAVAGELEPVRVRLTLDRDGRLETGVDPPPSSAEGPVTLAIDEGRVDPGDALLFHKTTRRERYLRAARAHPRAGDVVLVNTRGEVTETTIANLTVRIAGRWWTPPLSCGLLPGTARAALLADGTLAERTITVAELRGAEAIALVNSVRGWREAILLRGG
jgi:para-aminobenzoate synthetase / 4-amino-4-deoxychorismate lyase